MVNGDPQYFRYLKHPSPIDHTLDLSNSSGVSTWMWKPTIDWETSNITSYTISSKPKIHFKKILPYQYHQITYDLIDNLVNFEFSLNIVDYDYLNSQTLAYSLEFAYIPDDVPLYFECLLNDIDSYDIIEIDEHDSRHLTFGYVKCEVVGVTGFTLADRILLKVLDKKDLE